MVDKLILENYFKENILRPRTMKSYSQAMQKFTSCMNELGLNSIKQVTRDSLLEWRERELRVKGLTAISWNSYCRQLRAVFTFALEQGLVHWPENHFKTLQVRTPGKRKKTLSDEQIAKIHEVFSNLVREENENRYSGRIHPTWFWSIVFETLYYTGMRRNQLLNIRLKDVSLGNQTIFLSIQGSKAHSENIIPIPNGLVEVLGILLARAKEIRFKPDDQLFNVTRFGTNRYKYKTMQDSNISNAFRELSARLDFPASPHRLRHTLGTKLMRQPEKNLHLVKAIFGHKDIRTTLEYVVPDLEDMRDLLNTMPKLTK